MEVADPPTAQSQKEELDSSPMTRTASPTPDYLQKFSPDPRPWSTRSLLYQYRPFRGMYHDVKRRLPFYASDWGFGSGFWTTGEKSNNLQRVIATTIRMYFLNVFPAISYIIDMNERTDGAYGLNEALLASALPAIVFSIFSCQPLTIVGVTGLINLQNYTTFAILQSYDNVDFLQFQAWVLIWSAIMHFIVAIFNISDYTRFITDMTGDTFGFYVGVIYVEKGIELLVYEFEESATGGFCSVMLAFFFAFFLYYLERVGMQPFLSLRIRRLFSDYSFAIAAVLFTGFGRLPGFIRGSGMQYLEITASFLPSTNRNWIVPFWELPVRFVFLALPFGFLLTTLFYFDNNVSSLMAQSRKFPIKRPAGFHWDFFLLGITTLISGILGLPAPNGLVPQAPDNTASLCVLEMVDNDDESSRGSSGKIITTRVVEQRISHFLMGLAILGSMSTPLLTLYGYMSRAMFAGVFLIVGWGSIEGNPIVHRTLFLLRDPKLIPRNHELRNVGRGAIARFVAVQWVWFAVIIAVSQIIAAICFPVIIILLIPFRHYIIPSFISPHDLAILDAPTANSDAVFVSLGGPLVDKEDVIEGRKDVESRSTAVEEERVGEEKDGVRLRKL